jgi:hypothetical protein
MSLKGALEPNQIKCYCGHTSYCDCSPLEEPKQETLEEFIKVELEGYDEIDFSTYERFITLGAKWQQERMYSEIDLEVAFFEGRENSLTFIEWFEQFKKKHLEYDTNTDTTT